MKLIGLRSRKTNSFNRSSGFALPTILIASIIMLSALLVSVISTAAVSTSLQAQYYNQLAKNAGDAGIAYANACLAANGGVPQWSDANPLTPGTNCAGNHLPGFTCPTASTDARCSLTVNGGVISTFSVGMDPSTLVNGMASKIKSVGSTELLRTSTVSIWRQYNQTSIDTPTQYISATVQVLVVAGGGGGSTGENSAGDGGGGGGGAGGYIIDYTHALTAQSYSVVVGGGGSGGATNTKGNDSSIDSISAVGGGKGAWGYGGAGNVGGDGGSGGGGGRTGVGGNGTTGQGYAGGTSASGNGGGGGGASSAGSGRTHGNGTANSISGASVTYAIGADGGQGAQAGASGASGAVNTGNGGRGGDGGGVGGAGGAGGSGIVIISYPTGSITATGGVVTTSGGNTIHTFTTSGNFVVSAGQRTSCKAILDAGESTGNGMYWIYPTGSTGLNVYCDMTDDGGGWTLVLQNNAAVTTPAPAWTAATTGNTILGTPSFDLTTFDQLVGLSFWNNIGTTLRAEVGSSPSVISHKATYTIGTMNAGNNYTIILSAENKLVGSTSPGLYTTHNNQPFTTSDADHDSSVNNCAQLYANHPWWYLACQSGNFFAGGNFQDAPYWTGTSTDYYAYGSIWLK